MNNIKNIATRHKAIRTKFEDGKTNEKRKYIWSSVFASGIFLIFTVLPATIGHALDYACETWERGCNTSYPFYSISVLLWLVSPAAAIIIWVLGHRRYKKAQDTYGSGSLRIIWSIVLAVYLIYANKYAGDLVNELIKVDSGHFGISVATFSIFYAPLEIYRSDIAKWVIDFYAPYKHVGFGIAFVIGFFIIYLVHKDKDKGKYKHKDKIATASLLFMLFSVWAYYAVYFIQNKDQTLKNFIVWADFNNNHRCEDPWLEGSKGVVFLDGGNVLALIEPAKLSPFGKELFLVAGPCTYTIWKKIESSSKNLKKDGSMTLDHPKNIQFSWPTQPYSDLVKLKPY